MSGRCPAPRAATRRLAAGAARGGGGGGGGVGAALPQDGDLQINVKAARGEGSSPAKSWPLFTLQPHVQFFALSGLRVAKVKGRKRWRGRAAGLWVGKCAKVSARRVPCEACAVVTGVSPGRRGGPCPDLAPSGTLEENRGQGERGKKKPQGLNPGNNISGTFEVAADLFLSLHKVLASGVENPGDLEIFFRETCRFLPVIKNCSGGNIMKLDIYVWNSRCLQSTRSMATQTANDRQF